MKEKKKQRTIELENHLVQILVDNKGKILNHKQIFAKLPADRQTGSPQDILPVLYQLVQEGTIEQRDEYKFFKLQARKKVEGVIDITRGGRIFLKVEGMEDDPVVEHSRINLLPFDRVEAEIVKQGKKTAKAEVVRLIAHAEKPFVGILMSRNKAFFVEADNLKFQKPFQVKFSDQLKPGLKVMFRIAEFRRDQNLPMAEVLEVLGKSGEHGTEMHAILAEFGLPEAFEDNVQSASDAISEKITPEDIQGREDYRQILTFTIDPETAKDFDDAISYRRLDNGNFEVGVHIADVSHYVTPGSVLDQEALNRATSVYLVDRVVPMLPFKLSDVICSLVPQQDRLTFAAIFEVTDKFEIVNTRFSKTIIYSDKRFSYEEAQDILNAGEGLYYQELFHLNTFAKFLSDKRFRNGAMSFESTEYRFVLDDDFKPISMAVKHRQDTNKLIEELMLLANRSVAEFIYNQKPRKPFIYRTHDEPSDQKLQDLKRFVAKFGYTLHIDDMKSFRESINEISREVEGKPEQDVVRNMSIRSMAKAVYTPNKPSHFGLAFNYYTHFTSPIRRYPDIIAHRLLHGYLQGLSMEQICKWDMNQLDAACKQSSKMEVQASEAERASIKYKQAEWMESQIGKQFTGVISGLTDFGMFVEIKEYRCEGMIRLSNIRDDHYEYDSHLMAIIGSRTFKQYKMGDEVEVIVSDSNKIKRTIDLELVTDFKPQKQHGRPQRPQRRRR
jgi:ribonuclease R